MPVFSKTAAYAAQHIADFGIRFDSVRVLIRGTPDTTVIVKDTTVFFDPNSPDITLDITVPVQSDGQRFNAGIDYRGPSGVVFHGTAIIQSHPPDQPAPPQQTLTINYVGPGARIRSIAVSPKTNTLLGNGSLPLNVTALDSSGASTIVPPLSWTSSNTTLATVSNTGVVQGQNRRGTATITASTPTGLTDNASVAFILPAASIALASGGGQSGKAGAALAGPAVVQVSASDGLGVGGVNVVFAAPAGGSVAPSSATTDASGRASTTLRLGSAAGPQSFAATAAGFSVGIPATATAGDPAAIAIVSGNPQTDSIRKTLAPLSVRVADQFNNVVSNVAVSWIRTSGTGALAAAASTTGADGVATNSYTLGATVGTEGVSASATGAGSVTFAFTTRSGGPATIAVVSGGTQTGRVSQPLGAPFVVRVLDAGGNAATNASVAWSATNGTIPPTSTTDGSGQTSNTMTAGTTVGGASATASIGNGQSVSFSATVQPGFVAQLAFSAQPTNSSAGAALPPVRVALRDAGGNATPAINAVTIALGNNPSGATLTGTLTKNAVAGTATFDDLKLDKASSGYTLVATSGSLPPVTSTAFNTVAGSAAAMTIVAGDNQPATVNTTVAVAPAVRITDATNNPIAGVAVTFTPGTGNGSVLPSGGVATTNALGIATLTSWTLGLSAGPQALIASAAGLQSVTLHAAAQAGAAFKLVLTNKGQLQTSASSGATLAPQPAIQVVDQFGNVVPAGPTMNVTATPTVGSNVSLGGTRTLALGPATGNVTYGGLTITGAGTTRLVFTEGSGVIKPDTSAAITVGAGTPTQLLLVPASPTTIIAVAGSSVTSPQLKVADGFGNGVGGVSVHFVVDTGTSPDIGVVGTADYTSDGSGFVTFSGRIPTRAGLYRVTATSPSITGASLAVTVGITPGIATQLGFVAPTPSPRVSTPAHAPIPVAVALFDQFGNIATTSGATPISVSLNPPTSVTATLNNGSSPVSTASGIAVFTNLSIDKAAVGYTLTASGGTFTTVTSPPFDITAAAPAKLVFAPQPSGTQIGQNMAVNVQIQDAFDNIVPATNTTVNLTMASGPPGGAVTGGGFAASSSGNVGYALSFNIVGAYTLTASSSPLASATSNSFNVSAGAVTQLTFGNAPSSAEALTNLSTIAISAKDVGGNVVAGATGNVTLTLSGGGASPGTLTGTATRALTNGVASFTGLQITAPGTAYQITATYNTLTANATFNVAGAPILTAIPGSFSVVPNGSASPAPKVRLTAADGATPLSGRSIVWAPSNGGGTIIKGSGSGSSITFPSTVPVATDANGEASLDAWTAPTGVTTGSVTLAASLNSSSIAPATFTMNIGPGAADHFTVAGPAAFVGTAQAGVTAFPTTPSQPSVTVQDAGNNAVPNARVYWTTSSPCASGFTLASSSTLANAQGVATTPALTVPSGVAGSCQVVASLNDNSNVISVPGRSRPATVVAQAATPTSNTSTASMMMDPTYTSFAFYAIMKPSGSNAWTGQGGDQNYATALNWSAGTAPTNSSQVWISAAPPAPALSADGVAGTLAMETGALSNLQLNTKTLTVSGNVEASTGGINNGTLKIEGSSATTVKGVLPSVVVGSTSACPASYSLAGTTTTGDVTVNCPLNIGANALNASGGLTVSTARGTLVMTNSSGTVGVVGLATFQGGSSTGSLTAGKIKLYGGFKALLLHDLADVYAPSGSHITSFEPLVDPVTQTVDMCASCSNGSQFNNTDFQQYSRVYFAKPAKFNGTFTVRTNAQVSSGSSSVLTVTGDVTTEIGATMSGVEEMDVTGGTRFPIFATASATSPALVTLGANLSMTAASKVTGNLVLNKQLTIGSQVLTVNGNFTTQTGTGKLNMTTAGGYVVVGGAAAFNGASTDGLLTNGTIEVRGNLTQTTAGGSPNAFKATVSHKTIFNGSAAQTVNFASTAGSSQFNDLSVENSSTAGVTFTSIGNAGRDVSIGESGGATVKLTLNGGNLNVVRNLNALNGAKLIQSGAGKRIIVDGAVIGNATSDFGGVDSVRVTGTTFPIYNNTTAGKAPQVTHLTPTSTMNVAANGTIAGGLSIQGPVSLNGKALVVKDSFIVSTSGSFDMSTAAGILSVGGKFAETGGSFNPTSALTKLNGTSAQTVSFSNAILNFFGKLEITNTSGVTFATNVGVSSDLAVKPNAKLTIANPRTLNFINASVLSLHAGSTFTIDGFVSTNAWICQRDTSNPTINGSNTTSSTDGSAYVIGKCTGAALP